MDKIESATRNLLSSVIVAGAAGLYLSAKAAAANVAAGMLIQNASAPDASGNFPTKVTEFGFNYSKSPEGTDPATITGDKTAPFDPPATGDATAPAAPAIGRLVGQTGVAFPRVAIALPKAEINGRASKYPVDDLVAPVKNADGVLAYDSIFLAPNDKVSDAKKSYSSVASSATKRFADAKPKRVFTCRLMDGAPWGQPGVTGMAVFRTE